MDKIVNNLVKASIIVIAIRIISSVISDMRRKKTNAKTTKDKTAESTNVDNRPRAIIAPMPRNATPKQRGRISRDQLARRNNTIEERRTPIRLYYCCLSFFSFCCVL